MGSPSSEYDRLGDSGLMGDPDHTAARFPLWPPRFPRWPPPARFPAWPPWMRAPPGEPGRPRATDTSGEPRPPRRLGGSGGGSAPYFGRGP